MHEETVAAQRAMSHDQLRWSWRLTCPTIVRCVPHREKVEPGLTIMGCGTHTTTSAIAAWSWRRQLVVGSNRFRPFDPAITICGHKW